MPLTFIHLSDIHFNKKSGDTFDIDLDLRSQVENDIKALKGKFPGIDGILITGDIAFSGQVQEYKTAGAWLNSLCVLAGCDKKSVFMTPGNHDVDRNVVNNSKALKHIHDTLRKSDPLKLDSELVDILQDDTYSSVIFDPMKQYNKFAAKYKCSVTPEKPFWQKDFSLDDGSTLRLHGLTSTIISDGNDNDRDNKLVLGQFQVMLPEEDGVTYLTLCHHPIDWLLDKDTVNGRLNIRAKVQLFGHKHMQSIERIELNTVNDTLRISSGAVHPDRRESGWRPRYNFISIESKGGGDSRRLLVRVYPRVWNDDALKFLSDPLAENKLYIDYSLPLDPWGDDSSGLDNSGENSFDTPKIIIKNHKSDPVFFTKTLIKEIKYKIDKNERPYFDVEIPVEKQLKNELINTKKKPNTDKNREKILLIKESIDEIEETKNKITIKINTLLSIQYEYEIFHDPDILAQIANRYIYNYYKIESFENIMENIKLGYHPENFIFDIEDDYFETPDDTVKFDIHKDDLCFPIWLNESEINQIKEKKFRTMSVDEFIDFVRIPRFFNFNLFNWDDENIWMNKIIPSILEKVPRFMEDELIEEGDYSSWSDLYNWYLGLG